MVDSYRDLADLGQIRPESKRVASKVVGLGQLWAAPVDVCLLFVKVWPTMSEMGRAVAPPRIGQHSWGLGCPRQLSGSFRAAFGQRRSSSGSPGVIIRDLWRVLFLNFLVTQLLMSAITGALQGRRHHKGVRGLKALSLSPIGRGRHLPVAERVSPRIAPPSCPRRRPTPFSRPPRPSTGDHCSIRSGSWVTVLGLSLTRVRFVGPL